MESIVKVEGVSKHYGSVQALDDVSFEVRPGEIFGLIGPDGAGKSTLFRCLLGGIDGYSGAIELDGREVRGLSRRELAARIAYIPQIHRPTFGYSVLDTALMGLTRELSPFRSPSAEQEKRAMEALEQVGVAHLARRNFATLSGGEQQLVLIARALCQRSDVLLMDEPTSSLDYGNQLRVLQRVSELAGQGYTVILSTHDPQHALRFSRRVLALRDGRVAAFGDTREVLTETLLRRLYGVDAALLDTAHGPAVVPKGGGHV